MNALHHSPLGVSTNATFMETIMQPLSFARRAKRWLMAAGLALAAMQGMPAAFAQPAADLPLGLDLDPGPTHTGEAEPFFEKTGKQINCDYVRYRLRFGAQGEPAKFLDPEFIAEMQQVRMDFRDTLPPGLEIVDVQVSGDGTGAGGGPLPAPVLSTTVTPNDTVKLDDFRLSTSDLDGSGEIHRRYIDFVITAKIDHAAFPAPAIVDNQGFVGIILVGGPAVMVPSHDPALPDDGNFATGEPTKIRIDVERCDRPPPPPPPGEECFKVERGEVDCVPGGGAFIYHMPVGPELGGKWVQLRTTAPGVTVAPLSQFVPLGGGVLNWTITGALPGDVVHLVVSGIETYAGPEEGVGLCCSQVIDLVIPEDIECPPGEGEPDIKVEKRADDVRCTPEGPCDFTIRVTNVGDAPYNGPIVLEEVTGPGAAPVVTGPNAPWACPPMVSPMVCTHPATTLNPGAWVELKLGFAPGPGWDWGAIRNCAEYDYAASGFPDVFGSTADDRACASIPICRRGDPQCDPPEKKADLRIVKDPRSLVCGADGVCSFLIRVFNNGTDNYVGPLTVIDEYPTGVPASSTFGPTPPWTCGPIGGGQFQCDHPGVVLVPGASVPISVVAVVGADYGDLIRNCAEVSAIPDETDLSNNRDCAEMRVPDRDPGQPALRITKTCEQGTALGAAVSCRITVISLGTAAPTGPVRVNDVATVLGTDTAIQILTVTPDGAEWACGAVPTDALSCQIPGAVMTPGTSRHFDVTVQSPTHARFENCARGNWGPAPGNDIVYPFGEACAEGGNVPPPIQVEKTGDKECRVGEPCTFEITITNGGTSAFTGPVRIGDAIGAGGTRLEGVEITEISPPFGCSPEPTALPMSCVATLTLGPGESRVHQVTVVIPEGGPLANIREPVSAQNCVGVVPPDTPVATAERLMSTASETSGRPGTQPYACHAFTIADKVEECSPGFVMNDAGRCVCPEGTTFRNGQCRTAGGQPPPLPPPPPPPPVEECKLLPGQIRTESGRCVCPRGTELRNGRCVKDEPTTQCKLLPGQIRTQDGRCICPRGTSLVRGQCRKDAPPQCKLLPGQIRTQDGRCVCPRGTSLVRGQCRKDAPPQCKLLPGQIRTQDGRCVCPRGTSLVRGQCRKDAPTQQQCSVPGQVRLDNGRCVCPRGTSLIRGACRKEQADRCPRGTIGTPPNCRKLQIQQISPDLQRLIQPTQRQKQQPQ
jgi:hypothetical protein